MCFFASSRLVFSFHLCSQVAVDDSAMHSVRVYWQQSNVTIMVDGHSVSHVISKQYDLNPRHVFMGSLPTSTTSTSRRKRRQTDVVIDFPAEHFEGILYDIRINDFLLPLHDDGASSSGDFDSYPLLATSNLVAGEETDDICAAQAPCDNNATCSNVFYNDFYCNCTEGFKGKVCAELDFCLNTQCPDDSECYDTFDGFECVANATFDGVASLVQYDHSLPNITEFSSLRFGFRTRALTGVLLHVRSTANVSVDLNQFLTLELFNGSLTVKADSGAGDVESGELRQVNDGDWHDVTVTLRDDAIVVQIHDLAETYTIDTIIAETNLHTFIAGSNQIFVAGLPDSYPDVYTINPVSQSYFKGCMDEVRMGPVLLPFFLRSELTNQTSENYFNSVALVDSSLSVATIGCQGDPVCDDNQCLNGATCVDEFNDYGCSCVIGFDEDFCQYNIDDCQDNGCGNGATCVDGVAEYTCTCVNGFTDDR